MTARFWLGLLLTLVFLWGCAGPQQGFHNPNQEVLSKTQLVLPENREKVTNSILNVMTTAGYRATSVTPNLMVFEKPVTSNAYQTFWGHSKTIRITYTLSEEQKQVKVSGNIQGVVRTGSGLAASFAPGEEIREYSSNPKGQKLLADLFNKIEQNLKANPS